MDISVFLARVIGLYLVLTIIGVLVNIKSMRSTINQILNDDALMLISGIMSLIIGILLVVSHNIWELDWRILITLIGWITLIKGASRLYIGEASQRFAKRMYSEERFLYITSGIFLLIGIYLCYMGFVVYA